MKFEKFVQDNKAKRQRALRKYQVEKKQNELKEKEWEELTQRLLVLEARCRGRGMCSDITCMMVCLYQATNAETNSSR